jgi:hypothetical protein
VSEAGALGRLIDVLRPLSPQLDKTKGLKKRKRSKKTEPPAASENAAVGKPGSVPRRRRPSPFGPHEALHATLSLLHDDRKRTGVAGAVGAAGTAGADEAPAGTPDTQPGPERARLIESARSTDVLAVVPEALHDQTLDGVAGVATAFSRLVSVGESTGGWTAEQRLERFYLESVAPYLNDPGDKRQLLAAGTQAGVLFDALRAQLPVELDLVADELEALCGKARTKIRQQRLHRLLHGGLLVHIPLAMAVLVLMVVHGFTALYY